MNPNAQVHAVFAELHTPSFWQYTSPSSSHLSTFKTSQFFPPWLYLQLHGLFSSLPKQTPPCKQNPSVSVHCSTTFATSHLIPEYSAGQTHPGPGILQVPSLSQKNPPLHRVTALEHPDPEKSRGHAQISW